jgi:hypothetical protein
MPNYAVKTGNVIYNTIVADSLAIAEEVAKATCIEITQELPLGIGWVYDEEYSEWAPPATNVYSHEGEY